MAPGPVYNRCLVSTTHKSARTKRQYRWYNTKGVAFGSWPGLQPLSCQHDTQVRAYKTPIPLVLPVRVEAKTASHRKSMNQTAIPFLFMRGGTSRGPYMLRADLPDDRDTLAAVLIAALGAGHPLNIDGIGGGATVTTKTAMLSPAEDDDEADVNYFFAQVDVNAPLVDFRPTCGNILSGVGPAAIEMGLVAPRDDTTRLRIRAVNTGALIEACIETPRGAVNYAGHTAIAGVPGTHAPVQLTFTGVVGSVTGALLPTGRIIERIDGFEVTCMDVAMPMCMGRAADFGITGYESCEELNANDDLLAAIEAVRRQAGPRMGLGDVRRSVTPKFALLARPRQGGTLAARYFTPWACHPSFAVTGAQCVSACALAPGSIADGIAAAPQGSPARIAIEHASGTIEALIDYDLTDGGLEVRACGLIRTARLLARGALYVPASVWTR